MSDHLPECHTSMIPDFHNERWICICAPLRACEQRVEETWSAIAGRDQYAKGYTAGLDAAREAVAALDIGRDVRFSADVQADALAAIDALREKP